jgi:hypothetical protein
MLIGALDDGLYLVWGHLCVGAFEPLPQPFDSRVQFL